MNSTIGQRLKDFIEFKKMEQVDFARSVGAPKQTLNHWLNNQSITVHWLTTIIQEYPDLNIYWLLLGKGDMLNVSNGIKTVEKESAPVYKSNEDLLLQRISLLEEIIRLQQQRDELKKV
jgi:transcriptional regulator with XRE-family HTH domain